MTMTTRVRMMIETIIVMTMTMTILIKMMILMITTMVLVYYLLAALVLQLLSPLDERQGRGIEDAGGKSWRQEVSGIGSGHVAHQPGEGILDLSTVVVEYVDVHDESGQDKALPGAGGLGSGGEPRGRARGGRGGARRRRGGGGSPCPVEEGSDTGHHAHHLP